MTSDSNGRDTKQKGRHKYLSAPMPRDTRFAGDTCLASDKAGRYAEHMRKQRARTRK